MKLEKIIDFLKRKMSKGHITESFTLKGVEIHDVCILLEEMVILKKKLKSKRLLLAGMAMQGIISRDTQFNNNIGLPDITVTINEAYAYADELLKQEGKDK